MKNKVKLEDFTNEAYEIQTTVCGCFGSGTNKKIEANVDLISRVIEFIVYIDRTSVARYSQLKDAIEHYNKI